MEAPAISTLGPEDEEDFPSSPQHTSTPTAASQMTKFRVNKIKLRVPDAPAQEANPHPSLEAPARRESEEEEEDQLIDDDLGHNAPGPSNVIPPAKPKRIRNRKSKIIVAQPASHSPIPPPEGITFMREEVMEDGTVGVGTGPLDANGNSTMMSAWQVEIPAVTPLPGGTTGDVWDVQSPNKAIKRRAPKKPVVPTTVPTVTRPKRAAPKKVEDNGSIGEGTPQPYFPSSSAHEPHREISMEEVQELAASGQLALAPLNPLPTRPFAVQPIPKTTSTYATSGPLERSTRKPRKWKIVHREIKTISGGRWIARTWSGDKESELMVPFEPVVNLPSANPSPVPSVLAKPKIRLKQSKMAATASPLGKVALEGDSRQPSDAPRTREPSLDTEMLSLAGEIEAEVEPRRNTKEVDMEMESFLGD